MIFGYNVGSLSTRTDASLVRGWAEALAMPEHKWAPPEHPDVALHQPMLLDADTAGELRTLDPVAPVWADIEFVSVGLLHLKCFAAAESDAAVLVQTAWQGRLQQVLVARERVTRRTLDPRGH